MIREYTPKYYVDIDYFIDFPNEIFMLFEAATPKIKNPQISVNCSTVCGLTNTLLRQQDRIHTISLSISRRRTRIHS